MTRWQTTLGAAIALMTACIPATASAATASVDCTNYNLNGSWQGWTCLTTAAQYASYKGTVEVKNVTGSLVTVGNSRGYVLSAPPAYRHVRGRWSRVSLRPQDVAPLYCTTTPPTTASCGHSGQALSVHHAPFGSGWSWVYLRATGWLAMPSQHLYIRLSPSWVMRYGSKVSCGSAGTQPSGLANAGATIYQCRYRANV